MRKRSGGVITVALVLGLLALVFGAVAGQKSVVPPAGEAPTIGVPPTYWSPAGSSDALTPRVAAVPTKIAQLQKPPQLVKVRIGYSPVFEQIPLFAAKELGYFAQEGIDADLVQFRAGAEMTAAMIGGSIDIQVTTTDRAIILFEKGQRVKNLVGMMNRVPQTVIVRKELNIPYGDMKALRGKVIGIASPGGGTDLHLRYYLKMAGLVPDKDVKIIAVGSGSAMLAAIHAQSVDGVNAVEPVTTLAVEVSKIATPVLDVAKDGPGLFKNMPWLALSATAKWIEANAETVKKVIRAQVRTHNELRADPRKALTVVKNYFEKIDPAVAESILRKQASFWAAPITEEEIRAAAQLDKELGLLTKEVTYDDVVVSKEFRDLWK